MKYIYLFLKRGLNRTNFCFKTLDNNFPSSLFAFTYRPIQATDTSSPCHPLNALPNLSNLTNDFLLGYTATTGTRCPISHQIAGPPIQPHSRPQKRHYRAPRIAMEPVAPAIVEMGQVAGGMGAKNQTNLS